MTTSADTDDMACAFCTHPRSDHRWWESDDGQQGYTDGECLHGEDTRARCACPMFMMRDDEKAPADSPGDLLHGLSIVHERPPAELDLMRRAIIAQEQTALAVSQLCDSLRAVVERLDPLVERLVEEELAADESG